MTDTLTIVDNRTGKKYELPIQDGTIRAMDLRKIKTGPDDFGLMTYDPAFMNTANCKSAITYIDGDRASCSTAAIPSSSSRRKAITSKPPISSSLASCRPPPSCTTGP